MESSVKAGEERRSGSGPLFRTPSDWQKALFVPLTILAWLTVFVIGGWLLAHVAKTILTLVLSGVVAFALTPLVSLLSRYMPRTLAIAVAYILGFGVIIGLGALLVVTAAAQVTNLVHELPAYAHQAQRYEPQLLKVLHPLGITRAKFEQEQARLLASIQDVGTRAAQSSLDIVSTVLGAVVDTVLVLILSVYLTANGPGIASKLRAETPRGRRAYTALFIAIINQVVGGYIRGTLTLALLIGFLVGLGMFLLHVPYPVLLGVLAFFMEFIPIIGVLVSGSICVVIALFQGPITAALVLVYFVFVHVIEGDVIGPRIMGKAVGIHPATALVALVAGTELFGLWGALFAAPLAGLVQAIGTAIWTEMRGGDPRTVLNLVGNAVTAKVEETVAQVGADTEVERRPRLHAEEGQPVAEHRS